MKSENYIKIKELERGVHNEENQTPGDETGFGDRFKVMNINQ